jgi:hypothetical protein
LPARRRHRGRRVGKAQPDHARIGHRAQVVDHHAAVVAVGHARDGDAEVARAGNGFGHRQVAGGEGQALVRVDQRGRAFVRGAAWAPHRR